MLYEIDTEQCCNNLQKPCFLSQPMTPFHIGSFNFWDKLNVRPVET